MKIRVLCIFLVFMAATPANAIITYSTYLQSMTTLNTEIDEATVLSARLHTFKVGAEERACGISYDLLVDDLVPGHAKAHERMAMFFYADQSSLRNMEFRKTLMTGRTYFTGVVRDGKKKFPEVFTLEAMAHALLPDGRGLVEARACLAELPQDFVYMPLEILASRDLPGQEFVRIRSSTLIDDSKAILGAYKERFYLKTESRDADKGPYLNEGGPFLEQQEKLGYEERPEHDNVVSYDALKAFVFAPKPPAH